MSSLVYCRDCGFREDSEDGYAAEHLLQSHTQESGHQNVEILKSEDIKKAEEIKAAARHPELDLFPDLRAKSNYLDVGVVDGHLYYGINTPGVGGMRETIILDDGRVFRNNLLRFKEDGVWNTSGENEIKDLFSYSTRIGEIMPRWNNHSIRKYLTGETVEKEEVHRQLHANIKEYMDFGEDEGVVDTQVCWVIGTYLYPIFWWFPHLLFWGPRESGKSKNGKLLMYLSFGGYKIGASSGVSAPTIYRTLEQNRGTVVLDEFEEIEKSDVQAVVNQLLNSSAERDANIIVLVQEGGQWTPRKFPIFTPKIVCNISGVNPTSLTRFIPFHLIKTKTNKGRMKPERNKKELQRVRDDLHILILQHWGEIKKIYETLELEELRNRDEDNWIPILSVAKWLGDGVYRNVLAHMKNSKDVVVETEDVEADFFYILLDNISNEPKKYSPSELVPWFINLDLGKSPAKWIGRRLSRYFKRCKSRESSGSKYLLDRDKVKDVVDRYYPTSEQTTLTTLTTQTTQTTQTTHNHTKPPNSNETEKQPTIKKKVDSVVSVVKSVWGRHYPPQTTTHTLPTDSRLIPTIIKIVKEQQNPDGINIEDLMHLASEEGLSPIQTKKAIDEGVKRGRIYSPRGDDHYILPP